MKKRPPFPTAKVALLMLPVLFLAAVAVWLSPRRHLPISPFQLVVKKVTVEPRRGLERLVITIESGHKGARPRWWRNGPSQHWAQNLKLVDNKGHAYPLAISVKGLAGYNEIFQTQPLLYKALVPQGYDTTKPGRIQGTVVMSNYKIPPKLLSIARFDVPLQLTP